MRRASFPAMSSWFHRSLLAEYTDEDIRALEPRSAVLTGVADKRGVFFTARIEHGERHVQATARTAPAALRLALSDLQALERVEVVSLLTGPAA